MNAPTPSDSNFAAWQRLRRWPALLSFALVFVVYALTASRYVQGGDNGEFATVFREGGSVHPSGYPLYVLWLRAWCWLPAVTPAHGAALATAILASLGVISLYTGMLAWGAGSAFAACGTALFAFAREPWLLSTSAEVFAMTHLWAAAVLCCSGPNAPVRGGRRAVALAILGGLVPSVHLIGVWLFPCFAYGLWRAARESSLARTLRALPAAGLGLLPFLYLPWVASAPRGRWVWGELQGPGGIVRHVLRSEYGMFTLSPTGAVGQSEASLRLLVERLGYELWGAPLLVVGLAGLLAWRRQWLKLRALWPVFAAFVLAGPVFAALGNIPPTSLGLAIVARFHVLPALLLVTLFSVLLSGAFEPQARRWPGWIGGVAPLGLAALQLAANLTVILRLNGPNVERYLVDTLETLPPGAVLLGDNDLRLFGMLYLQRARSIRQDVVHIAPSMMMRDWYRRRVTRALGAPVREPVGNAYDGPGLVVDLLAAGREVYTVDTDELMQPIVEAFPNYPIGTTVRLLRPGQREPTLSELVTLNESWYEAHPAPVAPLPAEARWERATRGDYARALRYLGGELSRQGRTAEAHPFLALSSRVLGDRASSSW